MDVSLFIYFVSAMVRTIGVRPHDEEMINNRNDKNEQNTSKQMKQKRKKNGKERMWIAFDVW